MRQEQRHRRRPDVLPVRAQAGNLLEAAPALAQAARLRGGRERLLSRRPTPFPGLQKDLPGVEIAKNEEKNLALRLLIRKAFFPENQIFRRDILQRSFFVKDLT